MKSKVYEGLIPKEEQQEFAEEVKEEAKAIVDKNPHSGGELTGDAVVSATYKVLKKKASDTKTVKKISKQQGIDVHDLVDWAGELAEEPAPA